MIISDPSDKPSLVPILPPLSLRKAPFCLMEGTSEQPQNLMVGGGYALVWGGRAAAVLAIEDSTLWSLNRITFRTAAHRRRTMYEQFTGGKK